jgi:hypothetical protein
MAVTLRRLKSVNLQGFASCENLRVKKYHDGFIGQQESHACTPMRIGRQRQ